MIRTACVWEATARKPGNVHPTASFQDVCYEDFVQSAAAAAPLLAQASEIGIGRAIRDAVVETRAAVGQNTNLGIILLIAPLAAVPSSQHLDQGIEATLASLTVEDATFCYEAIRLARPGGLGSAGSEDVKGDPTVTLLHAMQLAAHRDRIAAQYASGYHDVLVRGMSILDREAFLSGEAAPREIAIVELHIRLMAELPDTLIARKCGDMIARESADRAQRVLAAGWPRSNEGTQALSEFDDWLRADGHRRNPGTTADLVAAILFAALRDGRVPLPSQR